MEYLDLSRFITSLAVAFAIMLGKWIYFLLVGNNELLKQKSTSVELIDKVLKDNEWKKKENRLVLEESFELLFSKSLTFFEIKILLYSETPSAAFRTYLKYRTVLEMNENKTKYQYKKGKRPYWIFLNGKIFIPKPFIKGLFFYTLFAVPSSYAMTWLWSDASLSLDLGNLILFRFVDILFWLVAIAFLIEGMKYQNSEKEILKGFGDKFILK